jgi:ABC-type sugar transport system ATPase subunit
MDSQVDVNALPLVVMTGLSKSYGGVEALIDVNLAIDGGEIHGLCGENGAGKSTLIKCLSGVIKPNDGEVEFDRTPLSFGNVQLSEHVGIAVIHQESTTFPDLNTIENIFVGRELTRWRGIVLDHAAMRRQTQQLISRLGQSFNISIPVGKLSVAQRQMISIARALSHDCKLLVMDEPTASLSDRETEILLGLAKQLCEDGVSILYVSHRLEEVIDLSHRVTVLRDGRLVKTAATSSLDREQLIALMIGKEKYTASERQANVEDSTGKTDICLSVQQLTRCGYFSDVSIEVKRGEVVGLAGLVGAGRTEVARAIFGIDNYDSGLVKVNGQPVPRGNVRSAIRAGIALVPEDRQHQGLVLPMSVKQNLSLTILDSLTTCGWINNSAERELVDQLIADLDVRTSHHDLRVSMLSGGNQQKLVIGKWLASAPKLLILDEPTRGVDVGAKQQVHERIHDLASRGTSVLVVSSDLPELITLTDRIYVMCEGRVTGELSGDGITANRILELAFPQRENASSRQVASSPRGGET